MATLKELFQNHLHIGHRGDKWNPKMASFIHSKKNKVHVLDLEKTKTHLDAALNFLDAIKKKNGKALFVGTKPQTAFILTEFMNEENSKRFFYVDKKWSPGLLTNFDELRKRADYYLNLKSQFESGEISKYTKKEVARFKKELEKLDIAYHGVAEMRKRPDVVIVLDAVGDRLAIEEALGCKIPVVALVDTNADPDGIDFVIPANDDSVKSIRFIMNQMMSALQ